MKNTQTIVHNLEKRLENAERELKIYKKKAAENQEIIERFSNRDGKLDKNTSEVFLGSHKKNLISSSQNFETLKPHKKVADVEEVQIFSVKKQQFYDKLLKDGTTIAVTELEKSTQDMLQDFTPENSLDKNPKMNPWSQVHLD